MAMDQMYNYVGVEQVSCTNWGVYFDTRSPSTKPVGIRTYCHPPRPSAEYTTQGVVVCCRNVWAAPAKVASDWMPRNTFQRPLKPF